MKYSSQTLIDAVNSSLSSKKASTIYNVPERTIRSHRQQTLIKIGAGRNRYLNDEQEVYLVSLFQLLPEYGFRLTSSVALELSTDYFKSIGLSSKPGRKWLRSFVQRYQVHIKWKKEEKLEAIRAHMLSEETRKSWFSLLKSTLLKFKLMDKPAQIFNCDETGFCDKTQRKHVIVTSTTRHVFEKHGGGGKNYTTALIAISAAGQVISPFIIYAGKVLMNTWCCGGPDGARYSVTKKGYIDYSSFEFWLREMFIPATQHLNRPILLIMDGHNAHVSVSIIELMKQYQIVCLVLPPHCTHGLQPVDVVLFNNVKTDWSNIISNHFKSGKKTVKNSDIPRLMLQLFNGKQAFSTTRIVSSFARAGIWPFNQNAMVDKVVKTKAKSSSTPAPTNILIPPVNTSSSQPPSSITRILVPSTISSSSELSSSTTTNTVLPPIHTLLSERSSSRTTTNITAPPINTSSNRPSSSAMTTTANIHLPPTNISSNESLYTASLTQLSAKTPDFNSTHRLINLAMMTLDHATDTNISNLSFDLQQIKPIEPTTIEECDSIASSNEATFAVMRNVDFNTSMVQTTNSIETITPRSNEKQKNKPIETIDAVREVLVGFLQEQQHQQQNNTNPITTVRASRLNNTTGVNITEDEFLKRMQEKISSKTNTKTGKKKTILQGPRRSTRKKKPVQNNIYNDQENDFSMDFESNIEQNAGIEVTETRIWPSDKDATNL